MGKVVWLPGPANEFIAAYLKAKKKIDDFDTNGNIILIIERPTTILKSDIEDALSVYFGIEEKAKKITERTWGTMWVNLHGLKLEETTDTYVKISPLMPKKEFIGIRVTPEEKEELERKAKEQGINLSDYIRKKLFGR